MKKNIPNFITCLNLLSGCLAVVAAFHEQIIWSCYLIGLAAVFDFFDGLVARLFKAYSPIGKDLDSLADIVSFGVAPGVILFQMITISFEAYSIPLFERSLQVLAFASTGFLVTIFGAIRLAKFNIDERQATSFLGLPIPAGAIFIASLIPVLVWEHSLNLYHPPSNETLNQLREHFYFNDFDIASTELLFNPWFYIIVSIVISLLMISEIPLFAMKFKNIKSKENIIRFLFILLSLWLVYEYRLIGIPFIVILYVLLSLIDIVIKKILNHFNPPTNEIQS
ncbi:MAG: CDP-diacylglycerol--serine O-phosphatidyltransferase [Bacteroidetes bacterium]|nr:CDP-diacylglycerol--serine O-phosphatidyltransferase [Bacteroidota bacterium]